jgi:hypothetical protein
MEDVASKKKTEITARQKLAVECHLGGQMAIVFASSSLFPFPLPFIPVSLQFPAVFPLLQRRLLYIC